MEKSVIPSIGLLIRIPFHVTWVWLGDVPRNATVESVARPKLFTKIEELNVSTSAIDRAILSLSASVSIVVFCTPISFMGRLIRTVTSSMEYRFSGSCAKSVAERSIDRNSTERIARSMIGSRFYFQQNAPGFIPTWKRSSSAPLGL